ncbi:nitrate/nitrite transporter [Porphyromonas sp. COT-239 OH1446]|uniref:MFS transporter n=1 Tax=Porphyromonas sp. COT-239 OH1446 TaxID=1515613 RepID=UPI00052D19B2|nr:MFS transporter [Porphyromonas sp. COT-239 OH1446]KGN71369.1 transporter [Porphyromonas sp. COT-239 OH1446]
MTEQVKLTMRDKPLYRWAALILLSATMFFAYMFVDVLSPLQANLQELRGWDPSAYGHFAGSEMFLNVFVFFLIFAGIILDTIGARRTAILSGVVMVLGALVKYFAISEAFIGSSAEAWFSNNLNFPSEWWNITPFYAGMPASAKMAAVGFMIFGCGVEMAGITVSRAIVKWFRGYEMALAMGLEMAIARIGVAVVVLLGPKALGMGGVIDISRPVLLCTALVFIGLLSLIAFFFMDRKLDREVGASNEEKDDPFKPKDLVSLFTSPTFLIVALLCVLYYSAIFPFQKYAINMLQCNLQISAEDAGMIFFWFPLGAAAITPFLGNFLDRRGKGASMLIIGAVLMIVCHLTFAFLPHISSSLATPVALGAIVLLGISFSLVPASLWPSVPKLVDERLLGSAYAVIFWIQNIGLYSLPMVIGAVLRSSNPGVEDPLLYNYTQPMLVFASLGVAALVLAFVLKAMDRKKGYGLELPNVKE